MTNDQLAKFGRIRKVLIAVLALNWLVAFMKIAFGLYTRFTSMTADGFHSLSDGASNIIGLIGITLACRPPDKDHPYGHKKYETFFSLGIAALLFFVCYELLLKAFERFRHSSVPEINVVSLIVMLVTMGVNIAVMSYELKEGKRLKSDILISDSMHTRADIFTSVSVILAMIFVRMGFPVLDPIVTAVIAVFIAYAAFSITRQSSYVLCDAIMIDEKKIEKVVLSVKDVQACHKIRTRGREDDVYVDLHVQVNPDMHVDRAHQICYEIEGAIKSCIQGVNDVVVHIEPKERKRHK